MIQSYSFFYNCSKRKMFKKPQSLVNPLEIGQEMDKMGLTHEVNILRLSFSCWFGKRSTNKPMLLGLCISSIILKTKLFASSAIL